jgi:3-hydroxybutyryl-CoA dehydratase
MASISYEKRGMYFDEFEVGQKFSTAGRTVTEADIVAFAGLSGDYNQIHVDAEYSKNTPVGQRVAHGLLGLSIASGLAVQTGFLEGTIIAFREINSWRFLKPVFVGDTLHVDLEVLETKNLGRIGAGIVLIELDVVNQNDETVMKGTWSALIAVKSE